MKLPSIVLYVSVFAAAAGAQSMKIHTRSSSTPQSFLFAQIDSITFDLESSTQPGTGENTNLVYPADYLNLRNWKLTLPIGSAGSPTEIVQPALATYKHDEYFYLNTGKNGVHFKAHCGGVTTSGSGYPRSELREMNGSSRASWSTSSGTHTMAIRQAITHLPAVKQHLVAGQIHGASDDLIVIRLEGTKLFVDHNGANGPVLTTNYVLGTIFTVKFVASAGRVKIYYDGSSTPSDDYPASVSGCYFKAGCYTQSNTEKGDAASAYGEVVIYELSISHS